MGTKLKSKYGFWNKLKILSYVLRSKLINKNIRIIRFPIIIRGKKWIKFGRNFTTGYWCRLEVFSNNNSNGHIYFGENVQINDFVHISALQSVKIGNDCLFASHVYISDNSHGIYKVILDPAGLCLPQSVPDSSPAHREYFISPVNIGNNVWLGEGVIVLPGVSIGDGCVIGAHSIVNKNIPAYCIATGSPAKVIKKYSFETNKWVHI